MFLSQKYHESEGVEIEKFLRGNFSKFYFLKFAKRELELFGLDQSGIGENHEDFKDFKEKACELFNCWFIH